MERFVSTINSKKNGENWNFRSRISILTIARPCQKVWKKEKLVFSAKIENFERIAGAKIDISYRIRSIIEPLYRNKERESKHD